MMYGEENVTKNKHNWEFFDCFAVHAHIHVGLLYVHSIVENNLLFQFDNLTRERSRFVRTHTEDKTFRK